MLRFVPRAAQADGAPLGGLDGWFSMLLRGRGVDSEEKAARFLQPQLSQLNDPLLMQGMEKAVAILRRAAEEGQRVLVYGDYDCDGVCATAIMLETLSELGIQAGFRIPSRHTEGYGLNRKAVEEIAKEYRILLTVDCGVTNHEEVKLAQLLGMTVIVTDHHQLAETPSPADVVLNPLLGAYPFRRLCGAGVALKLTEALLGRAAAERRIDLAAIATVADLVPLVEENRVIVAAGLPRISGTDRPGLQAMLTLAGISGGVSAGQVAYRIAPRINSGGRLEDAAQCVELLISRDRPRAEEIASHLEQNNHLRQEMQDRITLKAEEDIRTAVDFHQDRVIIVMGEGWNNGIIGLAAGRICEKHHYPTIVLNRQGDIAVGSCRSIPGVNIHAMLTQCSDLFLRFGGHEQAAGLTMKAELVPELRRRLNLYIGEFCDPACYIPTREYDCELPLSQVTLDFIDRLELLQPCGYGNPSPVFLCRGAQVNQARPVGSEGQHLKLSLLQGGQLMDGIAFQQGELARQPLRTVDVLFSPERNEFRGRVTPQLQVEALKPGEGSEVLPQNLELFSPLLQELTLLAANNKAYSLAGDAIPAGDTIPARDAIPAVDAAGWPQEQAAGGAITAAGLRRLLRGAQGVLLLAHEQSRAAEALREGQTDICMGSVTDVHGYNTLLAGADVTRLRDVWHHLVLLDGDVLPGEAALLRQRCPRAQLHWMKPNPALQALLRSLLPDREALGRLYRALAAQRGAFSRQMLAQASGLSQEQTEAGLAILSQMGLCDWRAEPWQAKLLPRPAQKRSMEDSALYGYLAAMKDV